MLQLRSLYTLAAAGLLALAAAAPAQARSDVSWSVNVGVPGVVVGATNAYPMYGQPVYNQPVYVAPSPVYYAPPPPQVVYRPAPPVYYAPPPPRGYYGHGGHHHHHRHHGGGRHDRDYRGHGYR